MYSQAVDPDGLSSMAHVDKLAEYLVKLRNTSGLSQSNQQAATNILVEKAEPACQGPDCLC